MAAEVGLFVKGEIKLKKPETLRKREDFTNLYRRGKSSNGKHLVILYIKNGLSYNRKAFLASKKVGNSVCRNRARRLMKEAFRSTEAELPLGYDFLLIARSAAAEAKCADVETSLRSALRRAGFIK